jgi:hypothetical protein
MVFLSAALHCHFLQFILIEGLSQISNSYLEALDFWPSHVKRRKSEEDAPISGIFKLLSNCRRRSFGFAIWLCIRSAGRFHDARRHEPTWQAWFSTCPSGPTSRTQFAKYGYEQIGRGRLTNGTLIGARASRLGITLLTVNKRDFARIAEFCPLKWELW